MGNNNSTLHNGAQSAGRVGPPQLPTSRPDPHAVLPPRGTDNQLTLSPSPTGPHDLTPLKEVDYSTCQARAQGSGGVGQTVQPRTKVNPPVQQQPEKQSVS